MRRAKARRCSDLHHDLHQDPSEPIPPRFENEWIQRSGIPYLNRRTESSLHLARCVIFKQTLYCQRHAIPCRRCSCSITYSCRRLFYGFTLYYYYTHYLYSIAV